MQNQIVVKYIELQKQMIIHYRKEKTNTTLNRKTFYQRKESSMPY